MADLKSDNKNEKREGRPQVRLFIFKLTTNVSQSCYNNSHYSIVSKEPESKRDIEFISNLRPKWLLKMCTSAVVMVLLISRIERIGGERQR